MKQENLLERVFVINNPQEYAHLFINRASNQDGFVLVLAMMILVMVSLLGVFATTTSIFEMNIAGNERRVQRQFFRADSALNEDLATRPLGGKYGVPHVLQATGNHPCRTLLTNGSTPIAQYDPDTYGKNVQIFFTQRRGVSVPYIFEYRICATDKQNSTLVSLSAGVVHAQSPTGLFGAGGLEY